MTTLATAKTPQTTELWQAYRSNFPRHLIALSRYLQAETMYQLQRKGEHPELRLSFEPFISLIIDRDYRLTDLAELLAISKQACNQTANQIEKAGYIQRIAVPGDGRAKMITLTGHGRKLVAQGSAAVVKTLEAFEDCLGQQALNTLTRLLAQLAQGLKLPGCGFAGEPQAIQLSTLMPRLSDYVMRELMNMTIAKGHPGLKMSHGAILSLIGLNGGRIQQIARIQEVSKQAISAVAKDLEQLGYIQREADRHDTRQNLLKLSPRGLQVIEDSVSAIAELEKQFADIIGEADLLELKALSAQLFETLALESEQTDGNRDLRVLAEELKNQLGPSAAKQLAELLVG